MSDNQECVKKVKVFEGTSERIFTDVDKHIEDIVFEKKKFTVLVVEE